MTFTWIAVFCVFLCTLMFSFWGRRFDFKYRVVNIITSPNWLLYLFLLVPFVIKDCRSCEIDFRPWVAFEHEYYRSDVYNAIFVATSLIICELWLLWIPSHIYITSLPLDKRENVIFIRVSNILLGVLILFFQLSNCGYTM